MACALEQRLIEDMKSAMKAGERGKAALSVIRLVRAALQNAAIEKRHELTEEEATEVVAREVKQRREAAEEYGRLGQPEVAGRFKAEIVLLESYLPRPLTVEELREIVAEAIAETGATAKSDLGRVMSRVMPRTRGRADGRKVNELVGSMLADQ